MDLILFDFERTIERNIYIFFFRFFFSIKKSKTEICPFLIFFSVSLFFCLIELCSTFCRSVFTFPTSIIHRMLENLSSKLRNCAGFKGQIARKKERERESGKNKMKKKDNEKRGKRLRSIRDNRTRLGLREFSLQGRCHEYRGVYL